MYEAYSKKEYIRILTGIEPAGGGGGFEVVSLTDNRIVGLVTLVQKVL